MSTLYYAHQYVTTTLSKAGGLTTLETTGIVLQSTDGLDTTKPGIALLTYQDPLDVSKAEWITYTSINISKELVGVARAQEGSSAKTHNNGCAIAFPLSKSHINNLNDAVDPTLNTYGLHTNSLYRQALINGNFDVWQRGTTLTLANTTGFIADRWHCFAGGALSSIVFSQATATQVGSRYAMKIQRTAGNAVDSSVYCSQSLESDVAMKYRGKKVTVSFYAKCGANYSAASSNIYVRVRSGTSANENINSGYTGSADVINTTQALTTTMTRYTLTSSSVVASNALSLGLMLLSNMVGTAGADDSITIEQIELCVGDVALPLMPKSFEEELKACRRYCQAFGDSTTENIIGLGYGATTTIAAILVRLDTPMRTAPTLVATAGDWQITDLVAGGIDVTVLAMSSTNRASKYNVVLAATVAAGLTAGKPYFLWADGNANRNLYFESEL